MDWPSVSRRTVTQLLRIGVEGDEAALTELTPLVYEDFRRPRCIIT